MSSDQDEDTPHPAADAATAAVTAAVTAAAPPPPRPPPARRPRPSRCSAAEDGTLSRRQVLVGAGGAGLLVAAPAPAAAALARPQHQPAASDGTPEQVHLTWGRDPATSMTVSWASPSRP